MGWSCSSKAGKTLDAIQQFCHSQTGSSNTWQAGDKSYFFEVGREQPDGAITATIYKFVDNSRCIKSGSLRIEPDGKISRGPKILKDVPVLILSIQEDRATFEFLWEKSRGEPNLDNLWEAVKQSVDSYKPGGLNAHISQSLGYLPYPNSAKIYNLQTGEILASWKAGVFQVW